MNHFSRTSLLLACLLVNVTASQSQTNRRLAMDYLHRGTKELEAGNLDRALTHFNHAIELDQNYAAPYFSRGLVRKRQADHAGAIIDFTRSIELSPMAEAYLDLGATRKDQGDRDGAIADYNKAIEINPGYGDAFYNRAIVLDDKG